MKHLSETHIIKRCEKKQSKDLNGAVKLKHKKTTSRTTMTLRKHAYSNILKISPPKNENFQIKMSDIFHDSARNTDCELSLEPPRRGGSNEYPQSMF